MNKSGLVILSLILSMGMSQSVLAKNDKDKQKSLPPGLEKKVAQGKPLPPGWQKKLSVGEVMEREIYQRGKVVTRDDNGLVTISVEGEIFKVIENTREIVEILNK